MVEDAQVVRLEGIVSSELVAACRTNAIRRGDRAESLASMRALVKFSHPMGYAKDLAKVRVLTHSCEERTEKAVRLSPKQPRSDFLLSCSLHATPHQQLLSSLFRGETTVLSVNEDYLCPHVTSPPLATFARPGCG